MEMILVLAPEVQKSVQQLLSINRMVSFRCGSFREPSPDLRCLRCLPGAWRAPGRVEENTLDWASDAPRGPRYRSSQVVGRLGPALLTHLPLASKETSYGFWILKSKPLLSLVSVFLGCPGPLGRFASLRLLKGLSLGLLVAGRLTPFWCHIWILFGSFLDYAGCLLCAWGERKIRNYLAGFNNAPSLSTTEG